MWTRAIHGLETEEAVIIAAGVVTALICVLGIVAAIGKFRLLLAIVSFYIYCIYISASIYVWVLFFFCPGLGPGL